MFSPFDYRKHDAIKRGHVPGELRDRRYDVVDDLLSRKPGVFPVTALGLSSPDNAIFAYPALSHPTAGRGISSGRGCNRHAGPGQPPAGSVRTGRGLFYRHACAVDAPGRTVLPA
ncbi:MAG: hypothetical protein LUO98_03380, partial [Methanoregula sp.]|nr:hypothetical protein [Methanoregula sp.]